MAAQSLVKQGLRWRVGNRESIRVWRDKCLPSSSTHKVVSPRLFLHADTKVHELIDTSLATWKSSIINLIFLPQEAEISQGIPFSLRLPPNRVVLTETNNGVFSLRCAYRLVVKLNKSGRQGTSLYNSKLRLFWRTLWSLPMPHKVRYFGWRACRNVLSTKENLKKRRIIVEDGCELCSSGASETTFHALWLCPSAKETWSYSKVVVNEKMLSCQSFQDLQSGPALDILGPKARTKMRLLWLLVMEDKVGEDQLVKVISTAWAIWHNRNTTRVGGVKKSSQAISHWVANYVMEYRAAVEKDADVTEIVEPSPQCVWRLPDARWCEVNVDGARFAASHAVGLGVVIRDDQGVVLAAQSRKIEAPMGPLEAEVKAFEAGQLLARDIGMQNIVFEGDSLVIYNALSANTDPPFSVDAVVRGIQTLAAEFHAVKYSHVKIQGNVLDYLLPRHAFGIVDSFVWIEENPYFIKQALIYDVFFVI